MDAEIILDIVLSCLLGSMHLFALAMCLVWRIRRFRKGLHFSIAGLAALFSSFMLGVFMPIGGFTFMDGGRAGTKTLIVAVLFCPILLVFAILGICFCIYIDGSEVVKRTAFSETRIDLAKTGSYVDARNPSSKLIDIVIGDADHVIRFNGDRIEGDVNSFLKACAKAQGEK